jgi:exodeoxyribonuclease VII small subunit
VTPPASRSAKATAPTPAAAPAETDEGIAQLSYEQARDALVDVVRRLESGGETLEQSLALWQRGEALAAHCERWLAGARAQIEAAQAAQAPAGD